MARDSKNKPAAWQLIRYLVGQPGMKTWTSKGLALPSRSDVKPAAGRASFIAAAPAARPWQFAPAFTKVMDVANNELTAVLEGKQTIPGMLKKIETDGERRPVGSSFRPPPPRVCRPGEEEIIPDTLSEARMAATATRQTLGSARLREALVGYAFIAVPMGIFFVFFIYPLVYSVYISRYDWGVFGKIETLGWENYRELWHDEIFWRAMKNTSSTRWSSSRAEMALGAVARRDRQRRPPRAGRSSGPAFYFPSLASSAAITAIAIYILSADGLLNAVIGGQRAVVRRLGHRALGRSRA